MARYKVRKTDYARYNDILEEKFCKVEKNGYFHYDENACLEHLKAEYNKYLELYNSIDVKKIIVLSAGGAALGYGFKAAKLSYLLTVPASVLLAKKMYYRVRMNTFARLISIDSKEHVLKKEGK